MTERSQPHKHFVKQLVFLVVFLAGSLSVPSYSADLKETVDTKTESEVYLFKGDLVALKVYSLTRIAISSPDIVDITNADVNEVLIVGQKVGTTQIFIWDELGKRQVIASVLKEDLDLIMARAKKLFKEAGITEVTLTKNNYEGKVVASGKVPTAKFADFKAIMEKFGDNIISLVKEQKAQDLIQIDAQITELSTTLTKAMGIDWSTGSTSGAGVTLTYPETMPALSGKPQDYFKIGDFQRTSALLATISFLIAEGKARVLSKPSIVVSSGEAANLQVGGEIPVRTTTIGGTGGTSQENVSFKSYGISLNVTPEIQDEKINLTMTVTVTDIDASNAVGEDVAFTNRTVNTKLLLNDGQTIVIAGLIKQNRSESINRVPFISKIPIVGLLFRKKSSPTADLDQEMVITITPKIYKDETFEKGAAPKTQESASSIAETTQVPPPADKDKKGEGVNALNGALDSAEEKQTLVVDNAVKPLDEKNVSADLPGKVITTSDNEEMPTGVSRETNELEAPPAEEEFMPVEKEEATNEEVLTPSKDEAAEPASEESGQMTEKAVASYVQAVQKRIADAISFPYEAREKGWQGTVTLTLTILSDGMLQDVEIKKSSGYNIFDNDAKNTAQILSPFDPFPPELDLEEIVISLPIVYSQQMLTK